MDTGNGADGGAVMTPEEVVASITDVFYIMDSHGHYTNPDWVLDMSVMNLKGFIRDMVEIFTYRANLSRNAMMRIIHPSGSLVASTSRLRQWLRETFDADSLRHKAAFLMRKLVTSGLEQGDRDLGTLYVLTALTINSSGAASAMPWLYESAM